MTDEIRVRVWDKFGSTYNSAYNIDAQAAKNEPSPTVAKDYQA